MLEIGALDVKVESVSNTGLVVLKFTKLMLVPQNWTDIPG